MIINERDSRQNYILQAAQQIMTAARTAPKGKGLDIIEITTLTDEDIEKVSKKMRNIFDENGFKFFLRDADNILNANAIILIGTKGQSMGLNCGHCGFDTCNERVERVPCVINSVDVGIAIGSACAMAADLRIDSRVMFSAGLAAQKLGFLPECKQVYAIPLCVSSKNPFFDRKSKTENQ